MYEMLCTLWNVMYINEKLRNRGLQLGGSQLLQTYLENTG